MNKYLKQFLLRGLIFGGFGPIILAIICFIHAKIDSEAVFTGAEILANTISVYLLAFVHAGASVFNQIDKWGLNKSTTIHFATLYIAYSLCYLLNTWIPFDVKIFGIFTAIFITIYFAVWITVYLCVKSCSKKLNAKIQLNK